VGNLAVINTASSNEPRIEPSLRSPSPEQTGENDDLRHFIQVLDNAGLLVRVGNEVDWKFEIGRRTRTSRTPLLFENIKDYPGHRVFTNGLCNPVCIALALGLEPGTSRKAVIAEARKRIAVPVKASVVGNGPLQENIIRAGDINLLKLPVPHWSDLDAGRYLGTWHINVTKAPESGRRNVGVYRMQLLNAKQATVSASPRSHLAQHFARSEKAGRPLPMAVAIGVSEAVMMAAGSAYPEGLDEYELAGSLQQKSVQLLSCRGTSLEVPAQSEIVIEGSLQPGVRVQDGPYFDYTGKPNTNPAAFLFEANQIMFRHNPIFRGTSIGMPGAEDHQLFAFLAELGLVDFHGSRLKQAVQNILLTRRLFRAFQFSGRIGSLLGGSKTV